MRSQIADHQAQKRVVVQLVEEEADLAGGSEVGLGERGDEGVHCERQRDETPTAVEFALEQQALEHAEPVVLLFQEATRERVETGLDVGRVVVFRDEIEERVDGFDGIRGAAKRSFQKVQTATLHADAHEVGNVAGIEGLREDEIHNLTNRLGNLGFRNLLVASLLISVDACVYSIRMQTESATDHRFDKVRIFV